LILHLIVAKAPSDKRFAWLPSTATAAAVLLVCGFAAPGFTDRLEAFVYDRALRASSVAPPADIAIVAIDDASIARLGAWPWTAGVHAQLIQRLQTAGAPVVAFTMPFGAAPKSNGLQQLRAAIDLLQSDELGKSAQGEQLKKMLDSSVADLDQNALLVQAIAKHGNVVLPIEAQIAADEEPNAQQVTRLQEALQSVAADALYLDADALLLPQAASVAQIEAPAEILAMAAHGFGHTAFATDTARPQHIDLAAVRVGERLVPSLSLAIAAAMQGLNNGQIRFNDDALATLGRRTVQLDERLRWRPAYFPVAGERAIRELSYWQVLAGEVPPEQLRGKTILVGFNASFSAGNVGASGLSTPRSLAGSGEFAPVNLIAGALASVQLGRNYQHPGWALAVEWLLVVLVLIFAVRVLPTLGLTLSIAVTTLSAGALVALEIGVLNLAGVWFQFVLAVLTLLGGVAGLAGALLIKRLRRKRGRGGDAVESLRMLGLTFQGQGQLDLAYETFRRCPNDTQSLDLLYGIGQDYERRRQFTKAGEVYSHVASLNASYKDVAQRRDRMRRADLAQAPSKAGAKPAAQNAAPGEPPTIPLPQFDAANRKQTLGRYEIQRELGKGAMGVVYLGRDPKINRIVAIKAIALAEEFAEEDLADARERFFREAEMAGRLNHPGIVTVYDAGEDRGLAFIAMEYLRGEHLSHYAESLYLLPVARVLSLAARVADALDYAHKQNVVHRDIKPANIMFNKDTDELKITDFGIARLTDTSRTKTGIVLGTPSFMSPEQLEGRPLDGRSDLFALGVTTYQLLTGQLPFRADSMTRLMQKIATEPHVPLRSLRPELPELADQIIERTLAKSAFDRYQTGAEMALALRTCLKLTTRKEAIAR